MASSSRVCRGEATETSEAAAAAAAAAAQPRASHQLNHKARLAANKKNSNMNPNSNTNPIKGPQVFKPPCNSWQRAVFVPTEVKQPDGTITFEGGSYKCMQNGFAR
jgi:hypothetical protein